LAAGDAITDAYVRRVLPPGATAFLTPTPMSVPDRQRVPDTAERLARLEERLARIEAQMDINHSAPPVVLNPPSLPAVVPTEEELEFEVGQNWFAIAGILVLTLGAALLLSLPFAGVPVGVPSLVGYAVVAGLFVLARAWCRSFVLVSSYVRGAGMALLFLSTLRLIFPFSRHLVDANSVTAAGLLLVAVVVNLWLALRRQSPWLTGIALTSGAAAVAVVGLPWLGLAALVLLAIVAVVVTVRENWPVLNLAAMALVYTAYLGWALGPLFHGTPLHFATEPAAAPLVLLTCIVVFAAGLWRETPESKEGAWPAVHALSNCLLGYGVFFVHTLAAFSLAVAPLHATAFVVFLATAIAFWVRHHSRGPTFFYAMVGYVALSVAILKLSGIPAVFVWLSVQSVVVVATAIWFRSRFIVVANFLIYVAIVIGYMVVADRETGISVGFGIVALVSARILNWQRSRLELKTGLMRNAYLLSAFVVFPYALYHLVPVRYAGLAWIGLALGYYALNLVVQNQKYRWMGHATLLLTTFYLVVVGTRQFEPAYRVLSFLVLGTVLLVVSLVFTHLHRAQKRVNAASTPMPDPAAQLQPQSATADASESAET
jgi:hypothetical protein